MPPAPIFISQAGLVQHSDHDCCAASVLKRDKKEKEEVIAASSAMSDSKLRVSGFYSLHCKYFVYEADSRKR